MAHFNIDKYYDIYIWKGLKFYEKVSKPKTQELKLSVMVLVLPART